MPTSDISQVNATMPDTCADDDDRHAWGMRLSDRMREALADDDAVAASRLAQHGDGQTRDLAREYAFMVRGLGFTLQVLLLLLVSTASLGVGTNAAAQACSGAETDLTAVLMGMVCHFLDDVAL